MKKSLILILVALLVLSNIPMLSFASSLDDYTYEKQFLKDLGVFTESNFSEVTSTDVTRADFVYYLSRLLKISENPNVENSYFKDLEGFSEKLINYFAMSGYISKGEYFEPARNITAPEAYKILLTVLGYDVAAEVKGGYPSGYLIAASKLDWVKVEGDISINEMAALLFDAANTPYYSITSISMEGDIRYSDDYSETILSSLYDIYLEEGVVNSINGITISGSRETIKGTMCVNDKIFQNGIVNKPEDYLGRECEAFYFNRNGEKPEIFSLRVSDNDMSLHIDASMIKNLSDDMVLEYYKTNGNFENISKARLSTSIKVILNGSVVDKDIKNLFNNGLKRGSVILQKTNGSSLYNRAIIKNYQNMLVGYYDFGAKVFFDKLTQTTYNLSDYENVNIYSLNGEILTDSAFTSGNLISVATDGINNFEAIAGLVKVTGKVEAVHSKGAIISGTDYTYSSELSDEQKKIRSGDVYTFYLDMLNEIAYIEPGSGTFMGIAYLTGAIEGKGLNSSVKIQLYDKSGELREYDVSKNVKIDNEKVDTLSDFIDEFNDENDKIIPQVIRYSLDSEGQVSNIDTTKVSSKESPKNTLTQSHTVDETSANSKLKIQYTGDGNMRRVGLGNIIHNSTTMFLVPNDEKIKSGKFDERDFKIGGLNNVYADVSYDITCYKTNYDDLIEDIAVMFMENMDVLHTDNSARLFVMQRQSMSLNSDEVSKLHLVGFMGGTEVKIPLSDTFDTNKTLPDSGDLCALDMNSRGELIDFILLYDLSEDKVYAHKNPAEKEFMEFGKAQHYYPNTGDYLQTFQLSYGYVVDSIDRTSTISTKPVFNDPTCVEQIINNASWGFTLVDTDAKGEIVIKNGRMNDIKSFNNVGGDLSSTSKMIIYNRYQTVKDVIVYN